MTAREMAEARSDHCAQGDTARVLNDVSSNSSSSNTDGVQADGSNAAASAPSSSLLLFVGPGAEPASPQPTMRVTEAPSSCASTTESTSSRSLGLRALDNTTPSRLAIFRTKNWLRGAGRKRALESSDGTAQQPPKRRAVTSLFSNEPTQMPAVAAATITTFSSSSSADLDDAIDTESSATGGDATQDQNRLSDAVSGGSLSLSQSSQCAESYEDAQLRLQQEIRLGRCLEADLTRDNARMKLKMDVLRDDIDYYYELLAAIEAAAQAARNHTVGETVADKSSRSAEQCARLADAIQRIISAPKVEPHIASDDAIDR